MVVDINLNVTLLMKSLLSNTNTPYRSFESRDKLLGYL